jgi:hypothetical protein
MTSDHKFTTRIQKFPDFIDTNRVIGTEVNLIVEREGWLRPTNHPQFSIEIEINCEIFRENPIVGKIYHMAIKYDPRKLPEEEKSKFLLNAWSCNDYGHHSFTLTNVL